MQFDFIGMQALYLVAGPRGRRVRWPRRCEGRPPIHPDCQWATFVRNHDELTLDKLTRRGAAGGVRRLRPGAGDAGLRPRAHAPAAADARRRPAAHPDGLQPAVLPAGHAGALLRRGDRHGREPRRRGPDGRAHPDAVDARPQRRLLHRPARPAVQRWCPAATAPSTSTSRDQQRDPDSLWTFMQRLVQPYRECPELGWGEFAELGQPERSVLAHACTWRGSTIVAAHNFSPQPATVDVAVPDGAGGSWQLEDVHSGLCIDLDRGARRASTSRRTGTSGGACARPRPDRSASMYYVRHVLHRRHGEAQQQRTGHHPRSYAADTA